MAIRIAGKAAPRIRQAFTGLARVSPLFIRILFLMVPAFAHADLQWAADKVFVAADPSNGPAAAQYTFTNTGTYPIRVMGTRTACGCTAAVSDGRPVAPGATGTINVTFKTLNRHGLYEEPIEIDTNDPKAKMCTVTLRVLVQEAIDVLPTLLFWQEGEPLAPKVIRITVADGFKVSGVQATCANPQVQLDLDPVKTDADYRLVVTPTGRHIRAAIFVTAAIEGKRPRVITAHVRVL